MASPEIGKLSSMYAYAWRKGLKTTYYLRSRPATAIARQRSTAGGGLPARRYRCLHAHRPDQPDLENPEICEACQ